MADRQRDADRGSTDIDHGPTDSDRDPVDSDRESGSTDRDRRSDDRDRRSDDRDRRPHDATLRFEYGSAARARVIARSVRQEVGEIDGDRSAATVDRDGDAVVVRVAADDLVALRAGCNTWGSLVSVAERTTGIA